MKNIEVLAIGELNVDLILTGLGSMPIPGRELLAETCSLVMGSSTAICAAGLSKLGLKTSFVGKVGDDDYGRFATEALKSYSVDMSHLIVDRDIQTGITVSISSQDNKDRAMVTYLGAIDSLTTADVSMELLKQTQHIHVGSFFLQSSLRANLASLFQKAQTIGMTTSLDAGWDDSGNWDYGIKDVLSYTNIFLPNELEAEAISGKKDAKKAAESLAEICEICVVKCGPNGAIVSSKGETLSLPTYDAVVRDTTGAGDSFNAGFIFGYLKGFDLKKSTRIGNACGSVSVTKYGGASACASLEEAMSVIELGYVAK